MAVRGILRPPVIKARRWSSRVEPLFGEIHIETNRKQSNFCYLLVSIRARRFDFAANERRLRSARAPALLGQQALFFHNPLQPAHQRPILLLRLCHRRLSKMDFTSARHTLRQQRQIGAGNRSDFRITACCRRISHHYDGLSIGGNLYCTHRHPLGDQLSFVTMY